MHVDMELQQPVLHLSRKTNYHSAEADLDEGDLLSPIILASALTNDLNASLDGRHVL